jgi:hypothetical protein
MEEKWKTGSMVGLYCPGIMINTVQIQTQWQALGFLPAAILNIWETIDQTKMSPMLSSHWPADGTACPCNQTSTPKLITSSPGAVGPTHVHVPQPTAHDARKQGLQLSPQRNLEHTIPLHALTRNGT